MKTPQSLLWLSCLLIPFLFFTTCVSAELNTPRLSVFDRSTWVKNHDHVAAATLSEDLETFFYTQTLDHFNYRPESYTTFQQKYLINFKYWGGANSSAPIFAYLGPESALNSSHFSSIGFINHTALRFNALVVYIEHRYYGESIPYGSREEAFRNSSTLGYFSSSQALADYAELIIDLKKNLSANSSANFSSPVIVFGASYGGMLASWFRLKYPHVTLGALASSAPILYFDDITPQDGYYSIVSEGFKNTSVNCYNTILKSWSEIDKNDLAFLSQKFNTCRTLSSHNELKNYLINTYATAAQYNSPPYYRVSNICKAIDNGNTTDILSRVFAGLVVAKYGPLPCYVNNYQSETKSGWSWQTCSEMVMPIGRGINATMFQPAPFNLTSYIKYCNSSYGVIPRTHWITTHFGGHDIKHVLKRFGSNIIFSNGLRDPYSCGGVLESISPSLIALHTKNGSHCLDLRTPSSSKDYDPDWLVDQRNTEIKIIAGWLEKYYMDLEAKI